MYRARKDIVARSGLFTACRGGSFLLTCVSNASRLGFRPGCRVTCMIERGLSSCLQELEAIIYHICLTVRYSRSSSRQANVGSVKQNSHATAHGDLQRRISDVCVACELKRESYKQVKAMPSKPYSVYASTKKATTRPLPPPW